MAVSPQSKIGLQRSLSPFLNEESNQFQRDQGLYKAQEEGRNSNLNELAYLNTLTQYEEEEKQAYRANIYQYPHQQSMIEIQNNESVKARRESFIQPKVKNSQILYNQNELEDLSTKRESNKIEENQPLYSTISSWFSLDKIIDKLKDQDRAKRKKAVLQKALEYQQENRIQIRKIQLNQNAQNEGQNQANQSCERYKLCENIINITDLGVGVQLYFEYIRIIALLMILTTIIAFSMFVSCMMKGEDNKEVNIGFSRKSSVASYWLDDEPIPEWFGILHLVNIIAIIISLTSMEL